MNREINTVVLDKRRDIHIELQEFKGHQMVAVRVWAMPRDAEDCALRCPTTNGVNFKAQHLDAVILALQKAQRELAGDTETQAA